jgi:cytochrome c-type biogenesis protein CcmH
LPDDPDLLVEAAQSRLYASPERKLDAQAISWVRHALSVQPGHQRATWLLGISQRQEGRPAEAAKTWEPLLAQVDAATAATLRRQIDTARADAGLPPLPAPAESANPATSANALTVKVALDPGFAARVRLRGDTTVFVIARVPGGPPMPVAVEKHSLSELPLTMTLDDGDSPMPSQKLSALKEVEVFARLSASGDPMRQEGDLESKSVRVTLPTTAPVELVLGQSGE